MQQVMAQRKVQKAKFDAAEMMFDLWNQQNAAAELSFDNGLKKVEKT